MKRKNNIFIALFILLSSQVFYAQLNDSLRINYNYINSTPQNAEVYINDEYIGATPKFFMWGDSVFPKQLRIKLNNYADYTETIYDASLMNKTYALVPLTGSGKINLVKENKTTHFNKPRQVVPIVLSSLVTAGAGFAAYYFKSLAIENRDHYDIYGDTESMDRKKKYDIISGVSLAAFQLGLGALIYFLFIDN